MITPHAVIMSTPKDGMPLKVVIRRGDEILSEHAAPNAQAAEARIRMELGKLQASDGPRRSAAPAAPATSDGNAGEPEVASSFGWRGG